MAWRTPSSSFSSSPAAFSLHSTPALLKLGVSLARSLSLQSSYSLPLLFFTSSFLVSYYFSLSFSPWSDTVLRYQSVLRYPHPTPNAARKCTRRQFTTCETDLRQTLQPGRAEMDPSFLHYTRTRVQTGVLPRMALNQMVKSVSPDRTSNWWKAFCFNIFIAVWRLMPSVLDRATVTSTYLLKAERPKKSWTTLKPMSWCDSWTRIRAKHKHS